MDGSVWSPPKVRKIRYIQQKTKVSKMSLVPQPWLSCLTIWRTGWYPLAPASVIFCFCAKTPSRALFVNIFCKQSLIKTCYPPDGPFPLVRQNKMWHGHSWHCKGFKRPVWSVKRWFGGVSLHGLAFPGLPDSCHKTPRIEDARTNGWRVGGSYREKPNKSFCLFGRTVNRPKISSQA